MRQIQAHKVKLISTWEDKRWNGGEPAWAARSACPWGQQWEIACYTRGQCTPQFSVLFCFTLLIVLGESRFAHITTAKAAAILQLVWPFSNKCLLKILGVESHNHTVSVPPTPMKSASSAWHPDIARKQETHKPYLDVLFNNVLQSCVEFFGIFNLPLLQGTTC